MPSVHSRTRRPSDEPRASPRAHKCHVDYGFTVCYVRFSRHHCNMHHTTHAIRHQSQDHHDNTYYVPTSSVAFTAGLPAPMLHSVAATAREIGRGSAPQLARVTASAPRPRRLEQEYSFSHRRPQQQICQPATRSSPSAWPSRASPPPRPRRSRKLEGVKTEKLRRSHQTRQVTKRTHTCTPAGRRAHLTRGPEWHPRLLLPPPPPCRLAQRSPRPRPRRGPPRLPCDRPVSLPTTARCA